MASRSELQDILESIIGNGQVYFQPPATVQMKYPCIVYEISNADTIFANNLPYRVEKRYQITIIAKDPDSDIPGKVAMLPKCIFNRHFTADNLNHDVYNIFF